MTVVALVLTASSLAQVRQGGDGARNRNQDGGINLAPADPVLQVVSIDSYSRVVRMRGKDGKILNVQVGEDIYDLSKLKAGDRVQVNFLMPDGLGDPSKLKAANIWPVN